MQPRFLTCSRRLTGLRFASTIGLSLLAITAPALAADPDKAGEAIYRARCASCHGAGGEGAEDYPHPLAGDRSVKQLAKLIAKTMPER